MGRSVLPPPLPPVDLATYHRLVRTCSPLLALYECARSLLPVPSGVPAVPQGLGRQAGAPVWVHAAGRSRLRAAHALVDRLLAQDLTVLLTHGSVSGWRAASRRYAAQLASGQLRQAWAPVAGLRAALAFLDRHQPRCGLLVGAGVRPCLLQATQACGVPVVLLEARLGSLGYCGVRLAGRLMRDCYAGLSAVHACSPADARRLVLAGASDALAAGSLANKDGQALDRAMSAWAFASVCSRKPQPEARAAQRAFGV